MSVSRTLMSAALWLAIAAPVHAATVTLAWDPNPEPDVSNYNVYVRTQSGSFGAPLPVGTKRRGPLRDFRVAFRTILPCRRRVRQV